MYFILPACGQRISTTIPLASATKDIFPYHTSFAISPSPIQTGTALITRTPEPTATPFAHIIEKGDTLLGIALSYGIDVEDLQAANADVNPNMLVVGSQVIIPLGEDVQSSMMTPTPIPITLGDPTCYLTSDGGVWCFILIRNNYPYALENISAMIGLYTQRGNINIEKIAFPLLNRVGSGDRAPLVVFFPSPIPADFSVKTELLTAVAITNNNNRYLNGEIKIDDVNIHKGGSIATVYGQIIFNESRDYPGVVWLAVVAYGDNGDVVGVRKWEAIFPHQLPLPVSSGTPEVILTPPMLTILPVSFQVDVYSLGPEIKQVEVLIEARP